MAWRFELLNKPYGGITEGTVWDGEAGRGQGTGGAAVSQ